MTVKPLSTVLTVSPAKVLIVGAGAMGMTLGYHLHLAGARITFLVKPTGAADLSRSQNLYSYDDASLKTFSDFAVIAAPDKVADLSPDYLIVTLDGAATTAPEGTALLKALGRAIAATATVMIGGGVGVGLREHYLAATGLPSNRIMMGVLGSFAHQVGRASLPPHPPTDPAMLARADIAYRHYSKSGLLLEARFPDVARRFAALFDGNGVATCSVLEPHLYDIASKIPFPIYAGSELLGWPPVPELTKHKEVWRLTVGAVREIARLDRHGWRGKVAARLVTDWVAAKIWRSLEKNALPLDFQAFNAFHHGGKVAAQDLTILQQCARAGEAEGKPMSALKDLIGRLQAARVSAIASRRTAAEPSSDPT